MVNKIQVLLAEKGQREGRRISLHKAALEAGISYYTFRAIVNNEITDYPREALGRMCDYFRCNVGDILSYEEVAT